MDIFDEMFAFMTFFSDDRKTSKYKKNTPRPKIEKKVPKNTKETLNKPYLE